MTSAVTHFEIYGNDLNKLAEFYRELFGWKIEKEAGIDYFQIQTGPPEASGIRADCSIAPYRALAVGSTTSRWIRLTRRLIAFRAWGAKWCARRPRYPR